LDKKFLIAFQQKDFPDPGVAKGITKVTTFLFYLMTSFVSSGSIILTGFSDFYTS